MKCISIESYFIKIIKNTKSKLKEPQKHIKMTRPNHKFDLAQKRKPKKHKIQNKSTKSKRKAQLPKPKKLKSVNNGMSKSKHLCWGCLNCWNKNWTDASKNESSKSKVNRMRVWEPVWLSPVCFSTRVRVWAYDVMDWIISCSKQLQEMVGWTTQRCMFLLSYVVFYETLLLIVSTFNNLNILLSTILVQLFYVWLCSVRIENI